MIRRATICRCPRPYRQVSRSALTHHQSGTRRKRNWWNNCRSILVCSKSCPRACMGRKEVLNENFMKNQTNYTLLATNQLLGLVVFYYLISIDINAMAIFQANLFLYFQCCCWQYSHLIWINCTGIGRFYSRYLAKVALIPRSVCDTLIAIAWKRGQGLNEQNQAQYFFTTLKRLSNKQFIK